MYFIGSGEVEIVISPEPWQLGTGEFFGEIVLLTGAPHTATVVATDACTLLRLDIVEFRELTGRQTDLARVIYDAVHHASAPELSSSASAQRRWTLTSPHDSVAVADRLCCDTCPSMAYPSGRQRGCRRRQGQNR